MVCGKLVGIPVLWFILSNMFKLFELLVDMYFA
jgi:hypothetical protein